MSKTSRDPNAQSKSLDSRYELRHELGRGGMGVVFRAFDRTVGREVAYKRLSLGEEGVRARATALFQREFTTLARLAHPSIVEVYEYGHDKHGPYYTMELLAGGDLRSAAKLSVHDVCSVLRDVASALALLHARRLVHRDVSPGNVHIAEDGRAKLLDFGALTTFGVPPDLVGTPAFLPPESLARERLDHRADLYSLGALAYWVLTRRPVVRATTLDELPRAWAQPVERPSLTLDLPKGLEELVLWLLNKDPAARPGSAAEVVERLTAIAGLPPERDEQRVAYSYLAHPPLVGRDAILGRIELLLGRTLAGQGASVLIEGPPGAGRSALLAHAMLEAELAGATVISADASAGSSAFGLARALRDSAWHVAPRAARASEPSLSYLDDALLEDGVRSRGQAWSPLEASQRQARTLAATEQLLLNASAENPTILAIDELHRADAESLALIASLAERTKEHPLLLLVSASSEASAAEAFAKIRASAERLLLPDLTVDDTQELVQSVFGDVQNSHRLARYLHEQGGGRPARTLDLARLLLQRGLIRYAQGTFALPYDVAAETLSSESEGALLTRIADLSAGARAVAEFSSLQEVPLHVALIARALGLELRQVILAVEELRAREVVSVVDRRVALRSIALREAIAGSLPEQARRELHRKAARSLLDEQKNSGELRMQAGIHLLKAGDELAAAELLTERSDGDWLSGKTPVPLLEAVLDVLRRQGRRDEQCLNALVPLVRGGFFGDMRAQRRHLDCTLEALANVCGVRTAEKLTPMLGPKLALICGVLAAVVRHGFTPKKYRFGTFKDTMAALLSILSATTAAAASAFDSDDSLRIVRMFEPLRGFGPDSAPYLTIEFCLATAEVGGGQFKRAVERYSRLLERFERPVQGMNEEVHLQFRQGILHGLAQAKAVDTRREALQLADELEQKHVFFAPHAEVIRASYHGTRGEQQICDEHKRRGELLALRGGISWSSVTVMTVRSLYMAMQTGDVVGAVRLLPEFDRLAEIAPKMRLYRRAAEAYLELARGRAEAAVRLYEELFRDPLASGMAAHFVDRVAYGRALAASGRVREAKQLSEQLEILGEQQAKSYERGAIELAAYCEALEGNTKSATARLEQLLRELAPYENPLWLGNLHRELARIALLEGDRASFDQHFALLRDLYGSTKNPTLLKQIDELYNEAEAKRTPPRPRTAPALSDELDELSTVIESDAERIAGTSRELSRANDNDEDEGLETLPKMSG